MQQAFAASGAPVLGGLDLLIAALFDPLDAGASGPLIADVQRHLGVVYRSVLATGVHVVVTQVDALSGPHLVRRHQGSVHVKGALAAS